MNSLLQNFVPAGRPEPSLVTVRGIFAGWPATFIRGIWVVRRLSRCESLRTEDCTFGMQQNFWLRAIRVQQVQSKATNFGAYL